MTAPDMGSVRAVVTLELVSVRVDVTVPLRSGAREECGVT